MEYISRWLAEAVDFGNEDKIYDEVAKTITDATNGFEDESGSVEFDDISEALIARTILEDNYPTVDIDESEEKVKVTFSKTETESLREATWISGMYDEILPDKNPANWVGNKGASATGGMAMGEDYGEEEPTFYCPNCGIELSYLGGQGDYEEFTCDDCGEYWYLDPFSGDQSLISAEEAWGKWEEPLEESKKKKKYSFETSSAEIAKRLMDDVGKCSISCSRNNERGSYRFCMNRVKGEEDEIRNIITNLLKKRYKAIRVNVEATNRPEQYMVDFTLPKLNEAIEKHDELNQDIFDGDELRPEVKEKLFQIVDNFKNNLKDDDVELDIKDVVIVGSNASYNFTDKSDIDLHILADLSVYDGMEDLAQKLYNAYKTLWNNKFDPLIRGHEVEIYVEPADAYEKEPEVEVEVESLTESLILTEAVSNGVYSLYNGWIKYPEKDDIPEPPDISSEVDDYTTKADMCQTIDDIDDFIDNIYVLRQTSILQDGEYGKGNLIFKELRNNGILQNLKDKKVELQNKEMSL